MQLKSLDEQIRDAVEELGEHVLVIMYDRLMSGERRTSQGELAGELRSRFGHTKGDLLSCMYGLGFAGLAKGTVDFILDEIREDGSKHGKGIRWIELTPKGIEAAVEIKKDAELIMKGVSTASSPYYSVFISYGGPDEDIARRIHETLRLRGVNTFFFPESAVPGVRLHRTMHDGVNEYDRIILLCSNKSLNRRGVLNEIEQLLVRESEEGGSELMIPIVIDNYLFDSWNPQKEDLRHQVVTRVVADFRGMEEDDTVFGVGIERILKAIRRDEGKSVYD